MISGVGSHNFEDRSLSPPIPFCPSQFQHTARKQTHTAHTAHTAHTMSNSTAAATAATAILPQSIKMPFLDDITGDDTDENDELFSLMPPSLSLRPRPGGLPSVHNGSYCSDTVMPSSIFAGSEPINVIVDDDAVLDEAADPPISKKPRLLSPSPQDPPSSATGFASNLEAAAAAAECSNETRENDSFVLRADPDESSSDAHAPAVFRLPMRLNTNVDEGFIKANASGLIRPSPVAAVTPSKTSPPVPSLSQDDDDHEASLLMMTPVPLSSSRADEMLRSPPRITRSRPVHCRLTAPLCPLGSTTTPRIPSLVPQHLLLPDTCHA